MKRILLVLLLATCAAAQPPLRISNAKIETSSASAGFETAVRGLVAQAKDTTWIGYEVETQSRRRFICCCSDNFRHFDKKNGCGGGCRLDGDHGTSYFNMSNGSCVSDEPQTQVIVLLRAQSGKITQVRAFTPDCAIDGNNAVVHWLTDVKEPESVRFLASLAQGGSGIDALHTENSALDALALHKDASADAALEAFLVPGTRSKLREQAAFWIGEERGHHGFEVLRKYIRSDSDEDFRKHLTFAISQSDDEEAVPELIRSAHQDHSGEVRGQALFWLAQKAGSKIAAEISDAIDNDPDTDVKKKAVFALSQMQSDEGVTKLIEVAGKNRNPAVRKEAIFWLGESHDPRALAYIEQLLLK